MKLYCPIFSKPEKYFECNKKECKKCNIHSKEFIASSIGFDSFEKMEDTVNIANTSKTGIKG